MESPEALDHFDPRLPLDGARTPPASWYLDADFLAWELEALLRRSWQPVCAAEALEEPGACLALPLLGEPLLLTRDGEGRLHGLRNACLHHGAALEPGPAGAGRLVCPYHGWSYELDGRLAGTPRCPPRPGLAPGEASLPRVAVCQAGPLVFAAPGDPPAPPGPPLPPALAPRLEDRGLAGLRFVERRRYPVACNWKVYVENFLDGGYHVAVAHGALASQLDAGSYRIEVHDDWVLQSAEARPEAAPGRGDFPERLEGGALYAFVHPNWMLNRYGPWLDLNRVEPRGPDRCEVVYDWFVEPDSAPGRDPALRQRALAASEQVQREDERLCEAVQRSLGSRAFERGHYVPGLEEGMHHFHRRIHAAGRGPVP